MCVLVSHPVKALGLKSVATGIIKFPPAPGSTPIYRLWRVKTVKRATFRKNAKNTQNNEVNVQINHCCVDGKTSDKWQVDWKDRVLCTFLCRRVRFGRLLRLEKHWSNISAPEEFNDCSKRNLIQIENNANNYRHKRIKIPCLQRRFARSNVINSRNLPAYDSLYKYYDLCQIMSKNIDTN